jgi:putative restriction endonuclease
VISHGLPLTKIHHAAFDAHLIGIDPDFRIHVSDRLLEIHDGPFLELGLKWIVGQVIQLPRRLEDRPDRDPLARRFEESKKAAEACPGASRRTAILVQIGSTQG